MKTNVMKAAFNETKTNFDDLELLVLDENETKETNGGGYYVIADGKLVWVDK